MDPADAGAATPGPAAADGAPPPAAGAPAGDASPDAAGGAGGGATVGGAPSPDAPAPAGGEGGSGEAGGGAGPGDQVPQPGAAGGPPPGAGAGGGAQVVDPDGPLGSACRPILQPTFPRLVVEVDAQDGAALPQSVVDHLLGTVAAVADKPAGIDVAIGVVPGPAREWTLEDIRAVAAATRDVANTADTVAIHAVSLAGRPDPDDERIASSIGIAFDATQFVVFPERVDALTSLVGGEAILRSVVVHELGHLLCLVNVGMVSAIPHEDPAHPGHSSNRGSVMFHAIETTAVAQLFSGAPPDTFDADDLADLEGLRTGRY